MDLPSCEAFHTSKVPSPHSSSRAKGGSRSLFLDPSSQSTLTILWGWATENLKKCLIGIAIILRLNLSTAFWGVSLVQALQLRGPHLEGNHPTRVFFSGDLSSFPPLSSHPCFPAYSPLPHPSPHNCIEEGSVPNSVSSWMAGWGPDRQASLGMEGQPGGAGP